MDFNLLRGILHDVLDEKFAVTQLAYSPSLCSFSRLMVHFALRVNPRFLRAFLAIAQSAVCTVDHFVFVFKLFAARWTLLNALRVQIRSRTIEDGLAIVEYIFTFTNLELARLCKKLFDLVFLLTYLN